jgi:hypothetical protein
VSSIEARQHRALSIDISKETPKNHKTVSTEKAQHTEIPLPRNKEPLRFGSIRAKFARDSVRSAARGSRVQLIPGITEFQCWSEPLICLCI